MAVLPNDPRRQQLPALNQFLSGVGQGWNTGQQMFDAGVAGLARAAGYQDVARDWERSADQQAQEAAQYATPESQVMPWREGGGGWGAAVPWAANLAGQFVGGAAPLVAGGLVGAAAAPLVPEAIGGAALASGLGMGLASLPQSIGANYQAEREANAAQGLGEVTPEQAQSASVWGVPSAALNAFAPTRAIGVGKTAAQTAGRGLLEAAKDVARTGIDNAIATGAQTAITQQFRPDMSEADKQKERIDSIVTGFLGGAGMGAAGEGVGRLVKTLHGQTPTAELDAYTKQVLEPEKAVQDDVGRVQQSIQGEGLPVRGRDIADARDVGGFRQEAQEVSQEGFAPPIQEEVAPQDLSPPIDVPRQYLAEAEKAAKNGSLDEKISLLANDPAPAAKQRLSAMQFFKGLLKDETGAMRISSGMDEAADFEALMPKKEARVKEPRVQEPQALHDMIQAEGGFYHTPDTRGFGEKLAPVGDVDEIVTRKGIKTVLHKAEPIERQVLAERPDITDKAERAALGLGGADIHEMTRKAIEYGYLPEGSVPNDLVLALEGNERVYSAKDLDQARTFKAQQEAKEYDKVLKDNRKAIREQFPDEKPAVISRAAKLWADNPNEFAAEDAVRGARAEISGGPEVEGFAESAFMEPAEGVPVEQKRAPTPKQYQIEVKKLWSERPEEFSDTVSLLEQSGDTARAEAYRAYQAEQLAKAPPIVRKVGGAEAKFVRTPKGIERVATPADAKQPVDRPAGTPPIEGPLGVAPPVAPLPPKSAVPRSADAVLGGRGGGGEPPKPPSGGGGEPPMEPPRKPLPIKAADGSSLKTPEEINGALQRLVRTVKEGPVGRTMRDMGLYFTTEHHHDEMYGKLMPSFSQHRKDVEFRDAISQRMQAIAMSTQAEINGISKKQREAFDRSLKLERMYQLGMDPTKPWDQQPQRVLKGDAYNAYKKLHEEAQEHVNWFKSNPGADTVSQAIRTQYEHNYNAKAAAVLYQLLKDEKGLTEEQRARVLDPAERLINDPEADMSPTGAMSHFTQSLEEMMALSKEYLSSQPGLDKTPLAEFVKGIENQRGKLKDIPYSSLMRTGKYGLGFHILTGEDGLHSVEALDRIRVAVNSNGFSNVVIEPLGDQNYVFIRSDNQTQLANLKRALEPLMKAGDIQEEGFKFGTMDVFDKSPVASEVIRTVIKNIKADDRYKAPKDASPELVAGLERKRAEMISALQDMMIDLLPEASTVKSELHRDYIPGFEGDPLQALAKQSIEISQHVANLLGTSRVHDSLAMMKEDWLRSQNVNDPMHQYEPMLAALYNHAANRESERSLSIGGSWQDMLQSMVFSKSLGFNPSTAILQLLQLANYGVPELAKKVGFMKATTSLAGATSDAYKVMKAVTGEALKAGGLAITDMPITVDALKAAGLSDANTSFLIHVVNGGGIDTGGIARSLGHIAEARLTGSKATRGIDAATRAASAMGYYAETLSRVQMALAAKSVWEAKHGKATVGTPEWQKLIDYTHKTLKESLFDYANNNRSRATSNGPKGLLGNSTKLAFVFQSYWMMAAEKMYRELHNIISHAPGASEAEIKQARKEAWTFILGHVAATAAIGGALAIPGMTVYSKIYDKLADAADPEGGPHDMRQSFTNWLETQFGSTVGDAIAHGPTRLLGSDISSRTSEADFLPVASVFTDRGAWRPAIKKFMLQRIGAGESVLEELGGAIDKYNSGDVIGAGAAILPAGLRNVVLAGQQAATGSYRDSAGRVVPNATPTAGGVASQLVGFKPQPLARAQESNQALKRYDQTMDYESGNLVTQMVRALRDGDKVAFNRMLPVARKFEKEHPGHDIVDRAKDTFKREFKENDKALKTGVPYTRWTKDKRRTQMIEPYIDSLKGQ